MKRREWVCLGAAALLLGVSGWILWFRSHWRHSTTEFVERAGGCAVPITKMVGTPDKNVFIVMLHGLGANRRIMYPLSRSLAASNASVYVLDLPGHGDNSDSFSFGKVESCAAAVIESLARRKEIQLDRTVLMGHSMGGALAMKLADRFPTAATIAISPAPMVRTSSMPSAVVLPFPPPRRMPNNLLIFTGTYDLPFMKPAAKKLVEMAGGERQEAEDFRQRRAVRWLRLQRATHTSLIYNYLVWRFSDSWWRLALPMEFSDHYFFARGIFIYSIFGMLGLMLVFPLVTDGMAKVLRSQGTEASSAKLELTDAILRWAVAGMFAVSVLNFVVPLTFLRMYNGDYLASCLLVAGIMLCALLWKQRPEAGRTKDRPLQVPWRAVAVGGLMGLLTMLTFGAWMGWGLTDTWLNAPRWLRFPVIFLACVPFALAEEWALGKPGRPNKMFWARCRAQARRYTSFMLLRSVIYGSILFALYAYANEQILIAVLPMYMASFSIVARLGTDAVRRRTGSAAGAAVFAAMMMAWFMAAVFPIK